MAPRFVPRERKHKRIARLKADRDGESLNTNNEDDSNAQEIYPSSLGDREAKRLALRQEHLREAEQLSKVSSKKRKRLDKYIDTKLRKDENAELLRKLATQQVDTSLLRSSKKLGRVHESKRERLQRALNERDAGLQTAGEDNNVLFEERREVDHGREVEEPSQQSNSDECGESGAEDTRRVGDVAASVVAINGAFGSGLKRPLELDESGQPVIKKRKKQQRRREDSLPFPLVEESGDSDSATTEADNDAVDADGLAAIEEEEWEGFGSETLLSPAHRSDTSATSGDDLSDSQDFSDEESPDISPVVDMEGRVSAFKAWADSHRNEAIGFASSANATDNNAAATNFKPRPASPDPELTPALANGSSDSSHTTLAATTVPRAAEVQAARLELPVVQEEQRIIETINRNPITIVCGATGSGKTTQVPQMLFENGYGSHIGSTDSTSSTSPVTPQSRDIIGVTQPRRIAATSVAARVAHELGHEYSSRVAHQVRYDTNVSRSTAIKFMTDGILLREIQQDFPLSKYSVIVIDEAHERSVNTDILIGMLTRIVALRNELARESSERGNSRKWYPLKVVIMSATLQLTDFLENERLFRNGPPPVVEVEGRQFSVTEHFSRRTERDYVDEMVGKVARGHRKLPPGGMLVFLTAQQEIQTVAKSLRERLGGGRTYESAPSRASAETALEQDDFDDLHRITNGRADYLEGEDRSDSGSDADVALQEDDTEFYVEDQQSFQRGGLKPHILPLYAALPQSQQLRVFQPPPDNHRLIVLATNVAETSLTIPGIRYVFDCGRSKEKKYDQSTGVQQFEVDWISKASASQRKGRAGRTGPGHCYRLYSSAVYEQSFAKHKQPEILRTPIESTILQLKAMDIENVINFPFPTPPAPDQLQEAERLLRTLGAIDQRTGTITDLGKELTRYPVSPRYGKMLSLAKKYGVVSHAVAIVAGLAVGDLFVPELQTNRSEKGDEHSEDSDSDLNDRANVRNELIATARAAEQEHQSYTRAHATLSRWDDQSDIVKLLTAVAAHAESETKREGALKFCADFFLREKNMAEVQHLRQQLHSIVAAADPNIRVCDGQLSLPSEKERTTLNQIVAAGFIDQVAIRADLLKDNPITVGRKPKRANEVPYCTLSPSIDAEVQDRSSNALDQELARSVFVHSSSVLARLSPKEMPQYIIYGHLSRAAASHISGSKQKRTRMHPLTAIGPKALAALAEGTPLLEIGKPIGKIEELGLRRRQCWVGVGLRGAAGVGDAAWPLGAWKVVQRQRGGEWEVEKVLAR